MKQLIVELADRSYPIYIGENLLNDQALLTKHIPARQVMIVSNEVVAPLYLQRLTTALHQFDVQHVILPDGEHTKSLDTLSVIYDALMQSRFDRNCTLVALGGGVVGDITGFAAATYQRGVHFIQIPTTLLAQVDSSVGGKTGINHPQGKNMIGAFHQPLCVISDTATLNTLDERQLRAGIAEVIKYGLIHDADFFTWLENNMDGLLKRDPDLLSYAIEQSCRDKANVVSADEREAGQRALLNLGHTFGHAIESSVGYGAWLHGEAVATGMLMAAQFSVQLGILNESDLSRTRAILQLAKLPTNAPTTMSAADFLHFMSIDKKVKQGKINLVLMKKIGNAFVTSDYDALALEKFLDSFPRQ